MFLRILAILYSFICISAFAQTSTMPTLLIVGDSLSAGYGIDRQKGWPVQLQQQLSHSGYSHQVVNASISGDTTTNGLYKLPTLLKKHQPDWVLIQLGGNDGLRGVQVPASQRALGRMIELAQQQGSQVMLIGIELPPNYGELYNQAIQHMYQSLAEQYTIPLLPFLLSDVALREGWMQADGIHPTAEAQSTIMHNVWTVLAPAMAKATLTDKEKALPPKQ